MVNLIDRTIVLGTTRVITKFDVWWTVPGKGLFHSLEEALGTGGLVIPTPVAVAKDGFYEVIPPEVNPNEIPGNPSPD